MKLMFTIYTQVGLITGLIYYGKFVVVHLESSDCCG